MTTSKEDLAERAARRILAEVRKSVKKMGLNINRVPGWIRGSRIRTGWVDGSLIFIFEDSVKGDAYQSKGEVGADTVVLLDTQNFAPRGAVFAARESAGPIAIVGTYEDGKRTILNITAASPALFDCGYAGYHGPRILLNVFVWITPRSSETPLLTGFIPAAFYVHLDDLSDLNALWASIGERVMNVLVELHNSEAGSNYERLNTIAESHHLNKDRGVTVLGKTAGTELKELRKVRDFLTSQGYNAFLIEQLSDHPIASIEEKVRFWALASRFSVMVDRNPSGHIAEFEMLKSQRSILALIRPRSSRSTYMIGDEALVDVNFIRIFEFDTSPIEVIPEVIGWAEDLAQARAVAYDREYPWRGS